MKDTPHGAADTTPQVHADQQKQTLKFFFTPRDALAGEMEKLRRENPHAKDTTYVPDLVDALKARFGEALGEVALYAGEHTVYVDRAAIVDVCRFLREEAGFDYLCDMATVDRFTEEDRFEVVYNLVSIPHRKRLRLKVRVDEEDPVVPSITPVYRAANWHEREAWDMMGIRFEGHPDLRRIFLPEDFEYHPLRKDFPVLGIPGSLPLPPQQADGDLVYDPFPRAHGDLPED
ncbi:MAG TPA: NADH-quinone oxidoreductase subunit C [Rubricoccaceae bacterium]|nr:NADH-quinone oxidoreductase subunit C [Rubricoccaceae bacterium]